MGVEPCCGKLSDCSMGTELWIRCWQEPQVHLPEMLPLPQTSLRKTIFYTMFSFGSSLPQVLYTPGTIPRDCVMLSDSISLIFHFRNSLQLNKQTNKQIKTKNKQTKANPLLSELLSIPPAWFSAFFLVFSFKFYRV